MIRILSDNNKRMVATEVTLEHKHPGEFNLIKIYPGEKYQTIIGFGGALTEASAYVYSKASDENRKKLIDLYYGEDGNRYNLGRVHIQSCDFALGNYAYDDDPEDLLLENFSIERDEKYIIPLIKDALSKEKNLSLLASPWSPPAFMKTNGEMNHGGKLKDNYRAMWANMIARYLKEYEKRGIKIARLTVQNEPAATQTWDSCLYSGEEEAAFVKDYLKPALVHNGYSDVKICVWDHNKDILIDRVKESFLVPEASDSIDGIAFHWYTGTHFEQLEWASRTYPDKELIFTEGCVEYSRLADKTPLDYAEMYAKDILGNLKAGCNGILDWNIYLDEKGGPNHVGNYCDAPVMFNADEQKIDVKLSYYYIGHFSRYIKQGARRVLSSTYDNDIETVSFLNPDDSLVTVILNRRDVDKKAIVSTGDGCVEVEIPAHSIQTLVM